MSAPIETNPNIPARKPAEGIGESKEFGMETEDLLSMLRPDETSKPEDTSSLKEEEELSEEEGEEELVEEESDEPEEEEEVPSDEAAEEESGEEVWEIDGDEYSYSDLIKLKESGLREKDYTQKTQAVAKEKKESAAERSKFLELQQEAVATRTELLEALEAVKVHRGGSLKEFEETNWENLKEEYPEEYATRRADWAVALEQNRELEAAQNTLMQKNGEEIAQLRQEALRVESGKLQEQLPSWFDKTEGPKSRERVQKYAESIGLTAEHLTQTLDHRAIIILDAAAKYQEIVDGKKAAPKKKVRRVVKRLKSGVPPSKTQKSQKSRQDRFGKLLETGSDSAALDILRNMA